MRIPLRALVVGIALVGCGGDDSVEGFTVPGEAVFPEGIACDHATGDLYVGSTSDGAVFRGNVEEPGELEEFLPPGDDGRESLTGMKVDDRGRLFMAGRRTGRAFVYDTASGDLIRGYETAAPGEEGVLLNDLTFATDGAYLTDSFRPTIYRIPFEGDEVGELEPWLDLEGTPITYVEGGFGLNGITSSDDGRYLFTVHYDEGTLYRIDTSTQEVRTVDLGDDVLRTGDGLLLDARTLFAVVTEPEESVVRIELSEDLTSGEVTDTLTDDTFRYPTTVAQCGTDRIQVVSSQLDREGEEPELPFTVSDLEVDVP